MAPEKRAVTSVTISGNSFFVGSSRFFLKGVNYQLSGVTDPLSNADTCQRDIAEFQKLGLNSIRVLSVDPSANHDSCMQSLSNAGIYVAIDVQGLSASDTAGSYNSTYLQNVFATIDAFAKYDNTLLFSAGAAVVNPASSTGIPYVKAVVRDMKGYIQQKSYRTVPVGYSADLLPSSTFTSLITYLNCGPDEQRSDFFAFSDYAWCGQSTFQQSGWSSTVSEFSSYSLPVFLSEYGCNTVQPRTFGDARALYSSSATNTWSGGLVYEYAQDSSNFGLVSISGNSVSELQDFTAFSSALASATPLGSASTFSANSCPTAGNSFSLGSFSGTALPAMPALPTSATAGSSSLQAGSGSSATTGPGSSATTGSGSSATAASGSGSTITGSGSVTTGSAAAATNPASSSSPTEASTTGSSSTNVGAIAGGVVGGLVALALIAGLVYFLVRRKKKQMRAALPEIQRYPVESKP